MGINPDENSDCPICTYELPEDETRSKPPCGHQFHFVCLTTWMKVQLNGNSSRCTCPYCRREFEFAEIQRYDPEKGTFQHVPAREKEQFQVVSRRAALKRFWTKALGIFLASLILSAFATGHAIDTVWHWISSSNVTNRMHCVTVYLSFVVLLVLDHYKFMPIFLNPNINLREKNCPRYL